MTDHHEVEPSPNELPVELLQEVESLLSNGGLRAVAKAINDLRKSEQQLREQCGHLEEENDGLWRENVSLHNQATTDYRTGLPNIRYLQESFEEYIDSNRSFGLLHFDVIKFKRVNDRRDHAEGDKVLRIVANCLAGVRESDTAAYLAIPGRRENIASRTGGDEFAVLVDLDTASERRVRDQHVTTEDLTDEQRLVIAGERIVERFESHDDIIAFNTWVPPEDGEDPVGLRYGHVVYRPGYTLEDMLRIADPEK